MTIPERPINPNKSSATILPKEMILQEPQTLAYTPRQSMAQTPNDQTTRDDANTSVLSKMLTPEFWAGTTTTPGSNSQHPKMSFTKERTKKKHKGDRSRNSVIDQSASMSYGQHSKLLQQDQSYQNLVGHSTKSKIGQLQIDVNI